MKCPRCDKPINDGESYCPHCGYKLEKRNQGHGS
ncbi:MAG: zinc-ribbon domain-containing protein [Dorea formicigenerans]